MNALDATVGRVRRTRREVDQRIIRWNRPTLLSFLACCALATVASAHDFWIDADTLRPAPNSTVSLSIRGGHYFPSSEIALADRLIGEFVVETPPARSRVESHIEGKQRKAELIIDSSETRRIALVIRRPQQTEPVAWTALILVPKGATSDPAAYPRGSGLEIVPRAPLESARKGEPMPLSILRDGAEIRSKFQVQAAEGGTTWLEAKENEPAQFMPRKAGRHLAIVYEQNQTATLVFEVAP